jgi:Cytosol aminopeptidase family, N-terminal domain.
MKIHLNHGPAAESEADVLVTLAFDKESGAPAAPFQAFYESGEFAGKALDTAILHSPQGFRAKRAVAAGAGARAKFDPAEMRKT